MKNIIFIMNFKLFILGFFLLFSTLLYSQEKIINIPNKTFSSSLVIETNTSKDMLLNINIFTVDNKLLIKKIELKVNPNSKYYKIDLSDLPKNSNFKIVIKENKNELFNELISNK